MPTPATSEDLAALERAIAEAAAVEATPRKPLLDGPKRMWFSFPQGCVTCRYLGHEAFAC
jgi:hypothetical protein